MPARRPPLPLILGFAAFLVVIAALIGASLVRPERLEFAPTPAGVLPSGGPGPDTVTLDTRDPGRWQYYSVRRGAITPPDTADWDLAFRRYHAITSGEAADAGANTSFEGVTAAAAFVDTNANTSSEGGVAAAAFVDTNANTSSEGGVAAAAFVFMKTTFARDTVNAALSRWYRYGFVTHLLRPNGHVYLVRTRGGPRIKLEFLSYYCLGGQPGCLTFRWAALTP